MKITKAQKKIQDRRSVVYKEYQTEDNGTVQEIVNRMAVKFNVSTITIYSDIKAKKGEPENGL